MLSIDIRTLILIITLVDFISFIVIALLWIQNRKRFKGLLFWVIDYGLQTLAMCFITLRGNIPDVLSLVVSNVMVQGGTLLMYIGLQRFVGKTSTQAHNYTILAIFIFIQTYYTFVQPNLMARTININLVLFIFCFQEMWLLLRRTDVAMRRITRDAGIAIGGVCLASLSRFSLALASPIHVNDFFKSGTADIVMLITQQLFFVFLTFSLILMVTQRLFNQVEILSNTDSLTGLLNRRSFEPAAKRELLLANRLKQPVVLLFLDIDYFKKVNDTYGHETGDNVLAEVAANCRRQIRETDLNVRLGGEEFAFLCPGTDANGGFMLAERMRNAIAKRIFNAGTAGIMVTVSIGVAEYIPEDTLDGLVKRADEALYRAKNQGRNKTVIWQILPA